MRIWIYNSKIFIFLCSFPSIFSIVVEHNIGIFGLIDFKPIESIINTFEWRSGLVIVRKSLGTKFSQVLKYRLCQLALMWVEMVKGISGICQKLLSQSVQFSIFLSECLTAKTTYYDDYLWEVQVCELVVKYRLGIYVDYVFGNSRFQQTIVNQVSNKFETNVDFPSLLNQWVFCLLFFLLVLVTSVMILQKLMVLMINDCFLLAK